MKKLLVFFIGAFCAYCVCFNFSYAQEGVVANYYDKSFELDMGCDNCSVFRGQINNLDIQEQIGVVEKILSMGFTLQQALQYVYPNLDSSIDKICKDIEKNPVEPGVFAIENSCKINFKNAKNGIKVDKNILFCDFFDAIKNGTLVSVKTYEEYPKITLKELEKSYLLVSSFETDFSKSSAERKNNIKLAMQSIDGKFIKSGETFSFNDTTGLRNEMNGYKSAKVIKNGEYVEGVGGGVCQVSTTLYNACILAGLTIVEVNNHSLPASYVLPGFDAMVNVGTSDLRVTNNTSNDFLITTCSNQDKCRVCLYGVRPQFEIKRRFDKYQELPADDGLTNANSKHDELCLQEVNYLIPPQNGCRVKSYLDYYIDGVLVKTEQIRDCTYLPRKGVVLKTDDGEVQEN